MKKGIAVPYIVAILLGIAVIVLMSYWFFVMGGKLSKEECQTRLGSYCTMWAAGGRKVEKPKGTEWAIVPSIIPDTTSDDTIREAWNRYAPGCKDYNIEPTKSACEAIVR